MKSITKNVVQISAKKAGGIDHPRFCERCFYRQERLKGFGSDLPGQFFPGIFSSIDVFTKRVVHDHFDRLGGAPRWLLQGPCAGAKGYVNPPHHSKFRVLDAAEEPAVLLTGEADGIFERSDGTYAIVDYKTARYSAGQDELLPVYRAQLNVYAHIAERHFGPDFRVSKLALIYMEPPEPKAPVPDGAVTAAGFDMGFRPTVVEVRRDPGAVPRLIAEVRHLHRLSSEPLGAPGCKDCASVERLAGLVQTGHTTRMTGRSN